MVFIGSKENFASLFLIWEGLRLFSQLLEVDPKVWAVPQVIQKMGSTSSIVLIDTLYIGWLSVLSSSKLVGSLGFVRCAKSSKFHQL